MQETKAPLTATRIGCFLCALLIGIKRQRKLKSASICQFLSLCPCQLGSLYLLVCTGWAIPDQSLRSCRHDRFKLKPLKPMIRNDPSLHSRFSFTLGPVPKVCNCTTASGTHLPLHGYEQDEKENLGCGLILLAALQTNVRCTKAWTITHWVYSIIYAWRILPKLRKRRRKQF